MPLASGIPIPEASVERYAIYYKIPLVSPFFKGGDLFFPLFGKEGPGEIY
jgi:hypothetical protein